MNHHNKFPETETAFEKDLKQFQNELSFMTFEGQQIQGAPKILEKLQVSKYKCLFFHS